MRERSLLVALMALLERENTVSIPQLARLLGASEEEVWNSLETLVFCYDAVSLRLDLHDAHATLERNGTDRLLRLNEEETGILIDALVAQGFEPDDGLCAKLLETKGFLEKASGEKTGSNAPGAPQPSVQMTGSGNDGSVVELLAAACDDPAHHLVELVYQKEGATGIERRTVEPDSLYSGNGRLYLRAWCRASGGWRTFRADRVKEARRLEGAFDPRAHVPESAGQPEPLPAHVRFAAGTRLPDWPGLGRPHVNDDGSMDVEVPWLGGLWLPKQLVGMQGDAVPLDPPELVEETRAYAQDLLAQI